MQQAGPGEQQRSLSGEGGAAAATGGRTSEAIREGGYNSDSEGTGPVLKGITHTAGHGHSHDSPDAAGASGSGGGGPSAGSPHRHGHTHGHGDSDRSAAVVAGEAAATSHTHALQDAAAQAGRRADASGVAHPMLHGEEQPGLFTRALEAAEELAASAAGKLKHGTQLATGTAPEQHPSDQLSALAESIAHMEQERAEDVAYQKAKKDLGM